MDTPLDILQIKIERAKENLPPETRKAINSVDWKAVILGMRETKGYSLEQLEDLELETELVLCGLSLPENYPKELEEKMKIPRPQVEQLVTEMNNLVFRKIKDELIKNNQRKDIFVKKTEEINQAPINNNPNIIGINEHISSPNVINTKPTNTTIPITTINKVPLPPQRNLEEKKVEVAPLEAVKTETVMKNENLSENPRIDSMLAQKFSGGFQMKAKKTEYSLNNISKEKVKTTLSQIPTNNNGQTTKVDPYRLDPNDI